LQNTIPITPELKKKHPMLPPPPLLQNDIRSTHLQILLRTAGAKVPEDLKDLSVAKPELRLGVGIPGGQTGDVAPLVPSPQAGRTLDVLVGRLHRLGDGVETVRVGVSSVGEGRLEILVTALRRLVVRVLEAARMQGRVEDFEERVWSVDGDLGLVDFLWHSGGGGCTRHACWSSRRGGVWS